MELLVRVGQREQQIARVDFVRQVEPFRWRSYDALNDAVVDNLIGDV